MDRLCTPDVGLKPSPGAASRHAGYPAAATKEGPRANAGGWADAESGTRRQAARCTIGARQLTPVQRSRTFKVTGRRSPKGGGGPQAQLAGGPVDRRVGRLATSDDTLGEHLLKHALLLGSRRHPCRGTIAEYLQLRVRQHCSESCTEAHIATSEHFLVARHQAEVVQHLGYVGGSQATGLVWIRGGGIEAGRRLPPPIRLIEVRVRSRNSCTPAPPAPG